MSVDLEALARQFAALAAQKKKSKTQSKTQAPRRPKAQRRRHVIDDSELPGIPEHQIPEGWYQPVVRRSDVERAKSAVGSVYGASPAAIEKVLAKHRDRKHIMDGGNGVSCYVWVSGKVYSENSLDLTGSVEADLRAIPGAHDVHINID